VRPATPDHDTRSARCKDRRVSQVKLLAPAVPKKVIAVGLNYQTHLGERPAATQPGLFAKMPTSIVGPEADIVYPSDAEKVQSRRTKDLIFDVRTIVSCVGVLRNRIAAPPTSR
jgi:2-keto-4-pentenoate hydratase/2-oxohepta-3-ene-1,7-dioic acid hydratase in catechol pathway